MERLESEMKHGIKISENAELIWGWTTPAGQHRVERRGEFFLKFGCIRNDKNVLELGCGTGVFTERVAEKCNNFYALDVSDILLRKAKEKSQLKDVKFLTASAECIPFTNNFFDCIFGSSVLHHLNLEKVLPEIYRILKPGGRLVFTEPNMLNPQIFLERNVGFIRRLTYTSPEESAFIRWKVAHQLRFTGFSKIKIIPFDFLHPRTPQVLIKFVERISAPLEKLPIVKEIAGSILIIGKK